jgi:hypothetical protein
VTGAAEVLAQSSISFCESDLHHERSGVDLWVMIIRRTSVTVSVAVTGDGG